jgi:glucose/arabinose dehydrogenase
VTNGDPYAIPNSNPFKTSGGDTAKIWAYGLRNPWRFSFDKSTGDMWIADVGGGQEKEEVNFQSRNATDAAGRNYGWHEYEGKTCISANGCSPTDKTFPVFYYDHTGGNCSIIGGYVYRGTQYPAMQGRYFMGDFCSGDIMSVTPDGKGAWTKKLELANSFNVRNSLTGFGEGPDGSIYVTSISEGKVYKLIAQ